MPNDRHDKKKKEYENRFKDAAEVLAEGARKVGLYVEDMGVVMSPPGSFDEPTPVMVCNFNIGDQAFSARVQDPDQDQMETEFKKLARQAETDNFEQLRERLARGEVFKADEAEADPESEEGETE